MNGVLETHNIISVTFSLLVNLVIVAASDHILA